MSDATIWVVGRRSAWPKGLPFDAEPPVSFVALANDSGGPITGGRLTPYYTGHQHFDRALSEAEQLRLAYPGRAVVACYGVSLAGAEAVMAPHPQQSCGGQL